MEIKASKSRTILIIAIPILLLALVAVVYIVQQNVVNNALNRLPIPKSQKTTNTQTKLPPLPSDLPIEAKANLRSNFGPTTPEQQANPVTYAYISTQTLPKTFGEYQAYFKKQGWVVTNTENEVDFKMIRAVKDKSSLIITFVEAEGVRTIAISRGLNPWYQPKS